jgi:cyclase
VGLAKRVIPVLLKRGNSLVKGKQFNSARVVGHPLQAARIHATRGVDELMLLDIGCDKPDFKTVERLTDTCFMPVTVGGGIKTLQDVRDLLNAGADKVAIHMNPKLVAKIADKYGGQAVCAVINWCDRRIPPMFAKRLEEIGAGEILLQSITRDGMMQGYDLDTLRYVTSRVNIPVIASCGCGSYEHMVEAIQTGASAVAAGAFFTFTNNTPKGASEYLAKHGIEARI